MATSNMTSSTSQSNYVYVIIRLQMLESINGIAGSLFYHYGETDDAFLIGCLVEPNETLMAGAIRHCRRLVDFCLRPNHRLYLAKVINGLVNHDPLRYLFIMWMFFIKTFVGGLDITPRGWLP